MSSIPVLALGRALLLGGRVRTAVQPASLAPPAPLPALPGVPGRPIAQDHDHGDPVLHEGSFAMSPVAQTSGLQGAVPRGVGSTGLDVKDGWAYECRTGAQCGFVVVDVREPARPKPVGEQAGVGCSDVKANDGGDLVFYGTQRNPPGELAAPGAAPGERLPRGVHVVDVADKAHPRVESFMPVPTNGVHTLHYVKQGSRELLLVQAYEPTTGSWTAGWARG